MLTERIDAFCARLGKIAPKKRSHYTGLQERFCPPYLFSRRAKNTTAIRAA